MKTGTVRTLFGPRDFAIEVFRDLDGVDKVVIAGQPFTPREADQIARLLGGAAFLAAAHNAGALDDDRKAARR